MATVLEGIRALTGTNTARGAIGLDGVDDPGRIPEEMQGLPVYAPDEIFSRIDRIESRKFKLVRDWKEAMAFYAGVQWCKWEATSLWTGNFVEKERGDPRTEATINRFRRSALAVVGLLTSGRPMPTAVPIGIGSEAVERARGVSGLIRHIWEVTKFQSALEDMVLWAVLTGNGFLKPYWDHDIGAPEPVLQPEVDPETGEPTGRMVETGQYTSPGQLVYDSISPFHVGFQDGVPFERSPWVYVRSAFDPDLLSDRFGIRIEPDCHPEDVSDGGVLRFDVAKHSGEPSMVAGAEWWEYPSKKFPTGLHMIATRKHRLHVGPWEKDRPRPLIHYRAMVMPGSPFGVGCGTDAIPTQKLKNRVATDIAEHLSTAGHPSIMGTEDQLRGVKFEVKPNAVIAIKVDERAPGWPQQIELDPLGDWVLGFDTMIEKWDERAWGVSDTFTGTPQDSDASGRSIAYRVERTAQNFANAASRLVQVIKDCAIAGIELYRENGPEEETLEVMGPDGRAAFIAFKKDQIDYRRLHLEDSSVLAGSRMALNEHVERLVELGMIPPEEGRRLISMPGLTLDQLDNAADDRGWARRNIEYLKSGGIPNIMDHMMLAVHYEETAAYMKKEEWFNLPDEIMGLFVDYLRMIKAEIQRKQAEEAAAAQGGAQPGAPAPAPAPANGGPEAVVPPVAESPDGGGGVPFESSLPGNTSPRTSQVGRPGEGGPGVVADEESRLRSML